MAENSKISQIKLPNGSTYDIEDNTSGYITGITSSDVTGALGFTPYNSTNPNGYTNNTGTITSVKTTAGAHTTINVSSGAVSFNVPTNTSHLTNDSGFLTSSDLASVLTYKGTKASVANLPTTGNVTGDVWHITADGSEYAWDGTIWQELGTAVDLSSYVTTDDSRLSDARTPLAHNQALSTITGAEDLQAIEALSGTSGFLKKTAANTWTLDTNTYLTSYTETDPVFSASAAAGITSTDISNWNAKVSDDKTWNGVTLNKSSSVSQSNIYIPYVANTSATTANLVQVVVDTTGISAANRIPKYNNSGYLVSTTPSANDNSTKVATTAYVDTAIPKVYSSTNTGGYLTMATLPIYDGTVV